MAARRGKLVVIFLFTVMVVSYIIMTRFVLGNLFWSGSSPESRQNLDADSDLSLTAPSRPTRHPSRKYGIGGSLPAKKLLYAIRATKAPKPVETVTVEVPETTSNITIEIVNFPTFFPIPQTKARNSMKFHIPNSKSQPEFFDEDDYDPKHPYKPTSAFDLSEQNVNNYFEYYYSLHREILDNKRPKRILCFKPNASGLGNKLLGFYTSFLLAMMTDRAFATTLVCDWPTFYDYFEMKIPVPHFKERQLRNATKLVYGPSCGPKPEYKTESFEKLFPSDIIIYQTNCPALDYFVKNPNCIERLRKIGFWPKRGKTQSYTKLKIETYMAHYVMRPTKVIRDIIMAEINKRSRDSIYTGLHIRTGNQTDFFVKNAKPFLSDNDIEYMVHTALKKSKSLGSRNKWFVSSDSTLVKTRIQSRNPDLVDTYNAQVLHSGGGAFRPKHQGVYDAIVEMYLLGASDDIFGTRGSTYSYIASLIARRDLTLIGLNDGPKHGFK